MAAKHGTRRRYVEGCRCEDCTEANRLYFRSAGPPVIHDPPPRLSRYPQRGRRIPWSPAFRLRSLD
jgi:hypothetical protein